MALVWPRWRCGGAWQGGDLRGAVKVHGGCMVGFGSWGVGIGVEGIVMEGKLWLHGVQRRCMVALAVALPWWVLVCGVWVLGTWDSFRRCRQTHSLLLQGQGEHL